MAQLRLPGLGPIVGHTTSESCRVWVRADPQDDSNDPKGSERRTIGVLGIYRKGGRRTNPMPCYYFRLHREFDRSGSINIGADTPVPNKPVPLEPDTEYVVRVGCLVLDDPVADDIRLSSQELLAKLPRAQVWREDLKNLDAEKSEATFRTFPAAGQGDDRLNFFLGSCRYPGLLWKVRHSDRIFGPMAEAAQSEDDKPRFVLMVGDQIYADLFNRVIPVGRADTFDEFRERYLTAFGSPNIRRLMRHLPTYMILDDHEIEDNWTQDRLRRSAKYQLFTIAIDAYLSYQWSHGPRSYGRRLYYRFDYGSYPFFVLDTRTQRFIEGIKGELSDNHMLGRPTLPGAPPGQLLRLTDWLQEQQSEGGNIPKFIVSSSVFVPNPMRARESMSDASKEDSDTWPGFPNTRSAILRTIVEQGIQNVVFLSGDIHCANLAEIRFDGTPEAQNLRALSVTSSAFYWPFPFADGEPSDYVHDSTASGQEDTFAFDLSDGRKITMDYSARNFTQEDNYCQLTVDRSESSLRVRFFDKRGDVVQEEDDKGGTNVLDETLGLEPW